VADLAIEASSFGSSAISGDLAGDQRAAGLSAGVGGSSCFGRLLLAASGLAAGYASALGYAGGPRELLFGYSTGRSSLAPANLTGTWALFAVSTAQTYVEEASAVVSMTSASAVSAGAARARASLVGTWRIAGYSRGWAGALATISRI
jgi:hypothetical protein